MLTNEMQVSIFHKIVMIIDKITFPSTNIITTETMLPKDINNFYNVNYLHLIMSIEHNYNIEIDDVLVDKGISIKNLVAYIESLLE